MSLLRNESGNRWGGVSTFGKGISRVETKGEFEMKPTSVTTMCTYTFVSMSSISPGNIENKCKEINKINDKGYLIKYKIIFLRIRYSSVLTADTTGLVGKNSTLCHSRVCGLASLEQTCRERTNCSFGNQFKVVEAESSPLPSYFHRQVRLLFDDTALGKVEDFLQ
uniref:Uncharacterized protein n=1 Tax=Heterorhabditis bacteriophora TaxID=37862 RepID=A0A1I7XIG9_HETBA